MERVEFYPDKEQFEVEYRAGSPMGDEFRKTVTNLVIFPGTRRFLGGVGDKLNKSEERIE